MTAHDDLLAELTGAIDDLSAPAVAGLYVGFCEALRPHYRRWAEHRGDSSEDLLAEALAVARRFARTGAGEPGDADLLARVEQATPEGDSPDEYSSTFAQDCWICGDLAVRTAVGQDGPAGYGVEYALDPIVISATERLFDVSQLGSGPDEDAQVAAVLAEPDVIAAVTACRQAIAHLADRAVLTEDDLQTVQRQVAAVSPR